MRAARVLLLLAVASALVGCGGPDPAEQRADLLAAVPVTAVERGVALWEGGPEDGFRSAVPAAALAEVLGIPAEAVTAVAETGGTPLTVLRGAISAAEVAEAAAAAGYEAAEIGGWTVLRRPGEAGTALQNAVPAAAVRGGLAVVGPPEEVAAAVDGAAAAATAAWVSALSEAAGEAPGLLLGPPAERLAAAAEGSGEDLDGLLRRTGTRGDLPAWEGWAAVVGAEEAALLLAFPPGSPREVAPAVALRVATGPVLGAGRRADDLLDAAGPRFDPESGVLRLPGTWRIDAADLRQEVERGSFAFLAPGPGPGS
jgi:hypothetical protein